MKYYLVLVLCFLFNVSAKAADKDSTVVYDLPDSVKAIQFIAEINVKDIKIHRRIGAGISVPGCQLYLSDTKGKRGIFFQTHEFSRQLSLGSGIKPLSHGGAYFDYKWEANKAYKLMIATAFDSASKLTVYSGYLYLPEENKWKFLGSFRHPFYDAYLKTPAVFIRRDKKTTANITFEQAWIQRNNGTWKNLKDEDLPNPSINLFGHTDSVHQRQTDIKLIESAIASGKTDVKENAEGVYYKILKEGTGRLVTVNDTVVAYYKGYLFVNDSVFDQTKDKPATFPLKRLIKGWQIGVPLCKVGGTIKLVIPSDLAYSIRTRSAKIPPNSILVFEIEVLDAKSPL